MAEMTKAQRAEHEVSEYENFPPLPDWVRRGVSFTLNFGPNNHNTGRKFHIRAIVDGMAVIREWSRHKQRWNYSVEGPWYFDVMRDRVIIKDGRAALEAEQADG